MLRRHNINTRWLALVLFAFLLVACGGSGAPVAYDPYARLNLAEQVARDAEAQIQATARQLEAEDQLTVARTTQLAAEVYATSAALEHQATAIALEATQQAPALFIQATQVAIYEHATQAALEATPLAATAQALVAAAAVNDSRAYREQVMSYVVPLGVTFLFLAGGAMIFLVGLDLGAWLIERDKMRQARYDSQFGFTTYDYDAARWVLEAPSDKYRSLPRPRKAEVTLSPGGVTAVSTISARDADPLVYNFLEKVKDKFGANVTQLPRWDKLGVTSETWQSAVHVMKANHIVDPRPREGTFIRDGKTVGQILYALDMDELILTPPPRQDAHSKR